MRGNGVLHRAQKPIQGDDNGHVGRPCGVSPACPYPEPLRVTGPLPSLVLRAEDMWRKLDTNTISSDLSVSLITVYTSVSLGVKPWRGGHQCVLKYRPTTCLSASADTGALREELQVGDQPRTLSMGFCGGDLGEDLVGKLWRGQQGAGAATVFMLSPPSAPFMCS